jgi:hypothetical protein
MGGVAYKPHNRQQLCFVLFKAFRAADQQPVWRPSRPVRETVLNFVTLVNASTHWNKSPS